MSQKIKNPNEKGSGFIVGIIALIAIVAVVIGVVLYMGRNQPIEGLPDEDVSFSVQADGNIVRLASDEAGDDAVVAEVYEDYSCSYCAEMANGGHADQLEALNNGELVVEYHPLNFLDRENIEGHSTKTLALMKRVAETGDASLYWNVHTLMLEDIQSAAKWDDEQLAERLEMMGAPSDLVDDVRNGALDRDAANAIGTANGEKLSGVTGSVSSPHVIVDGEEVTPKEAGTLGDWVKVALEAGKA